MKSSPLCLIFTLALLFGLSQESAHAQWIFGVSTMSENKAARTVQGTSSTQMDFKTQAYYFAYVKGYIYTQNPNTRLSSQEAANESNGIASVSTQVSGTTPGIAYHLRTEHFYYPRYPSCFSACNKWDYYGYEALIPFYTGISDYGPSHTFIPPNRFFEYWAPNWVWLGNTNTSIRTAPTLSLANPRVSGNIADTTRNALLGADVTLNASGSPTGGTYRWTFTGPFSVSGGAMNSSSVTIRSTNTGTLTANVTYTLDGPPASASSASITINSILPTLTGFTAQQGQDRVSAPGTCLSDSFWHYILGCGPTQQGMLFSSSVQAPAFISDPSQSGIKYVQAVSTLRKQVERGLRCNTKRSSDSDISSGWQLDTSDPYDPGGFPARRFSEGNALTMSTVDYPRNTLTFITPWEFVDALYVDDRFEMYVVYFTGDQANPSLQRLSWHGIGEAWLSLIGMARTLFTPFGSQMRHQA